MINKRLSKYHQKLIWSDNFLNNQNYISSSELKEKVFKYYIVKTSYLFKPLTLLGILLLSLLWIFLLWLDKKFYLFSIFIFCISYTTLLKFYRNLSSWKLLKITGRIKIHNTFSSWHIFRKNVLGVDYRDKNKSRYYLQRKDYLYFRKK